MATTALITVVVFGEYLIRFMCTERKWYRHMTFQAALAIFIMVLGHFLRASTSWLGFLWARMGWTAVGSGGSNGFALLAEPFWFNAAWVFIVATILITLGKLLIILAFAPDELTFGKHRISWGAHLKVMFVFLVGVPFFIGYMVHP
jgi:hypothetical protein